MTSAQDRATIYELRPIFNATTPVGDRRWQIQSWSGKGRWSLHAQSADVAGVRRIIREIRSWGYTRDDAGCRAFAAW